MSILFLHSHAANRCVSRCTPLLLLPRKQEWGIRKTQCCHLTRRLINTRREASPRLHGSKISRQLRFQTTSVKERNGSQPFVVVNKERGGIPTSTAMGSSGFDAFYAQPGFITRVALWCGAEFSKVLKHTASALSGRDMDDCQSDAKQRRLKSKKVETINMLIMNNKSRIKWFKL